MSIAFICLGVLLLGFAAMGALGLAMDRHFEQITGRPGPTRRCRFMARCAGCLLLCAALWMCIITWGPAVGFIAWLGFLTMGGLMVACLLAYAPG